MAVDLSYEYGYSDYGSEKTKLKELLGILLSLDHFTKLPYKKFELVYNIRTGMGFHLGFANGETYVEQTTGKIEFQNVKAKIQFNSREFIKVVQFEVDYQEEQKEMKAFRKLVLKDIENQDKREKENKNSIKNV